MPKLSLRSCAHGSAALIGGLMCAAGITNSSYAGLIDIEADLEHRFKGVGSLTGTIEYIFDAFNDQGLLTVTLTNTMAADSDSYITGLVFNLQSSDPLALTTLQSAPPKFQDALSQHVPPFGDEYAFGAALKGHFMGGGDPRDGIAPGETESFTFLVSAADAAALTPSSVLDGTFAHNFVVRFRSLGPAGTDIVPVQASSIPGPSVLLALAIAAAMLRGRSRRKFTSCS
jgi:hypothetical protein